jgi:hypothetical protein
MANVFGPSVRSALGVMVLLVVVTVRCATGMVWAPGMSSFGAPVLSSGSFYFGRAPDALVVVHPSEPLSMGLYDARSWTWRGWQSSLATWSLSSSCLLAATPCFGPEALCIPAPQNGTA